MDNLQGGILDRTGELMRTQDNLGTSYPLFIVQQSRRLYGMDPNYVGEYDWLCENTELVADDVTASVLNCLDSQGMDTEGWHKVYYIDIWEFVTVCFTRLAAEDFIEVNEHRLKNPRVYVETAYRNPEMIAVQELLKSK